MPNGGDQQLSILHEMSGLVKRGEERSKDLERRVDAIEVQREGDLKLSEEQFKTFTTNTTKEIADQFDKLPARLEKVIEAWADKHLEARFDAFHENKLKLAEAERQLLVAKWKNRLTLLTAGVLFIGAVATTCAPNMSVRGQAQMQKSIETLGGLN